MNETVGGGQRPVPENSNLSDPNVDTSGKDKRHAPRKIYQDGTPLPLTDLASDGEASDTGQVELVVTIVRAEGLTDSTPTGIFRWPKKGGPQHRYFRVSILDVTDGSHPLTSVDTSPFCTKGPEFCWGSGGDTGEELRLLMESTSLKCGGLLEMEMVQLESAGDDILLGRGQKALKDILSTAKWGSHSHWLHLTLNGNPKGKIEIIISTKMKTSNRDNNSSEGLDTGGGDELVESSLNSNDSTLARDLDKKRIQARAITGREQGDTPVKGEECQGSKPAGPSQKGSPKWEIPHILDLRSAINARITHAKKLNTSSLETAVGKETNPKAKDDATRNRNEGDSDTEQDNDKQSISDDEVKGNAPREHALPRRGDCGGRRDLLSARHNLKLTDSLQTKLTGGNEALWEEHEQNYRESQEGGVGTHESEGSLHHGSPIYLRGNRLSRSPLSGRTRQSTGEPNISHHPEGDKSVEESAIEPREQEAGTDDAISHASDSSDHVSVDNHAVTTPSAQRNEAIGRRNLFSQKGGESSLQSFLQETTSDIDSSEESKGNKPVSVSEDIPPGYGHGNGATSEIKRENVSTTKRLSPLDVAESMKAAAARLKTRLSSPTLTATVKGFSWPRRKENRGGDRNEDGNDQYIPRDALMDPVDQINPSTTPPSATSVEQAPAGVSGNVPTTASPTTSTLLITVFRASGLPDKSIKNIFGRKKQNVTQDPYVRLKVCNVAVATSFVKGGGSEFRWGKGKEGEIVEISLPSPTLLKGERLGSLRLCVEVWSKTSEERENDILLGSSELSLANWMGRRPAWAELDMGGNLTSRVKLSVGVKDSEKGDSEHIPEASRSSQHETSKRRGTGSDESMVVDATSPALVSGATGTMIAAVDNFNPIVDLKKTRETTEGSRSMPTMDENIPQEQGSVSRPTSSSGIPERTKVLGGKGDYSATDCNRSKAVSRLHSEGSDAPGPLKHEVEDLLGYDAAAAYDSAMNRSNGPPKRWSVTDTPDNDVNVQQLRVDPSETPAVINITVRVRKADSLAMPLSKTTFKRAKKSASHNPYVVFNVCGSKQSTSAVIGGGPKCRWPGKHGTVVLSVSYADLLAAGGGQPSRKDPKLGVEVWNQMNTGRTADTFIGSADVSLEDGLDNDATWISIIRENMCTGRIKLNVESPDLRRSGVFSRNGGISKVNGEEGSESKTGQDAHQAFLDLRSGVVEEDGPGVSVKGSAEGSSEIYTITSPEKGASSGESIPSKRQTTHYHPDPMQVKSCIPSPAVQQRSPSYSETVAKGQSPLSNSEDGRAQALAQAQSPDDVTMPHKQVNALGERTDEPDGTDGNNNVTDRKRRTTRELEKTTIDGAFGGLRRSKQGGTAKTLDLVTTSATANDIETAPSDDKTPRVFHATVGAIPAGTCVLSTTTREYPDVRATKQESEHPQTARPRIDEMNSDEFLHRRDLNKSLNDSSSEASNQPLVRITGEDYRNGTAGRGKTSSMSRFAQYPASESCRKISSEPPDPTTRVESSSVVPSSSLSLKEKVKHFARAREIARRRRGSNRVNQGWNGEHLGQGSIQTPFGIVTAERVYQVRAVTIIQSVLRGWFARRSLRRHQKAAANIQAIFRGYRERRYVLGLRTRTKRAREEEQRARDRRSRIASKQQELYLLRSTPAHQLTQIDLLRASAMVSRIQRFWRHLYGGMRCQNLIQESRREKGDVLGGGFKTIITAPEIKRLRSDRAPAVGLTLEALRQRVATRQRAKERSSEAIGPHNTCSHGLLDAPQENDTGRKLRTIESTYESLIRCRQQASRHVAALRRSEMERASSAKRRSERLANFRRLQDQLLHPPKLAGIESVLSNTDSSLVPAADVSGQPRGRKVGGVYGKWQVALDSSEQRRGETAHALAMAVTRKGGNKKWWAVSLPADVGYNELVDVRRKNPPWATSSVCEERGRHYAGGVTCNRDSRADTNDVVTSGRKYDSDEASLWWYTYASTEAGRADGQRREDVVFTELLERVKTNTSTGTSKRREQQKNQERERRLRISRKSQRIVDEVLRQQGVTRCPGLSCLRGRVTAVQRGAAIVIQRHVRGILQRKKTALLRAEMRVFGALQVIINELQQPELEGAGSGNPLHDIAGVLAEHSGGGRADARRTGACSAAARRAVLVPPIAASWSVSQPSSALAVRDKAMLP